jgi:hypothetical protein
MPRFEVKLAASHGIKLEGSKREPVEQTVIDPILALFAHMLLTPGFLQRSLLVLRIAPSSCQSHKANSVSIEFTHIPPAAQGGRERVDTISERVRNARPNQQIVFMRTAGNGGCSLAALPRIVTEIDDTAFGHHRTCQNTICTFSSLFCPVRMPLLIDKFRSDNRR